jgi:hypothetical protein
MMRQPIVLLLLLIQFSSSKIKKGIVRTNAQATLLERVRGT